MMKTQIFVMTHKKFNPPNNPIYIPLQVGAALNPDLGYMRDDVGDSISALNPYYGELTGMYWLWKNYHDADLIGICHYRRFFFNERGTLMTQEEYETFIRTVEEGSDDYIMFEILFWTGIREGELLALNKSDFDFRNNLLHITKTYNRIDKQDVITVPKTENSVRTINIPNFLKEKVQRYIDMHYGIPDDARLFPIVSRTLQKRMKRYAEKAGVKEIRVHDLRHSHAAYLIFQGIQPLMVKERLGHKDIKITLNTYGHLYPTEQKALADMLDEKRKMPRSEDLSKFPDNQKF